MAIAVRSNDSDITYKLLASGIASIAAGARSLGLSRSRVAVVTERKTNFVTSVLGLQLAECSIVVLNPQLPESYLSTTIQDASPVALVVDFDIRRSKIATAVSSLPHYQVAELSSATRVELDTFLANPAWAQPDLLDEWGVLFTSGSTGAPKAILHNNYSIVTELLAWVLELELRKSDCFYVARPIYYTGGLVLTLATLSIGGTVIVDDYEDLNDDAELLSRLRNASQHNKLDWLFLVPEQARRITRAQQGWNRPSNPASILVMGSPISAAEKRALSDYFDCRVVESWGNSEGLGTITSYDDLEIRPNSIGRPFMSERIFVIDDDGRSCPAFSRGRLAGSDETMFTEYLNRPEATDRAKRDSLVISDDLGYRDEEGYFYIVARVQDVINIKGDTVVLPDVEAKIRALDWVREICVGPVDSGPDIELYGLLELVPTAARSDPVILLNLLNKVLLRTERLTGAMVTRSMPRLASGKVDRVAARQVLSREFGSGCRQMD